VTADRLGGDGLRQGGEHDPALLVTGNQLGDVALVRRSALEAVGGFDERLSVELAWDLWMGLTAAGWRFVELDQVGFEMREPAVLDTTPDDARVAEAVIIVEKHRTFMARYLGAVVANYRTALLGRPAIDDPLADDGPAGRDRLDQVAEARAAQADAEADAAEARSRVAEVDAARVAADRERDGELVRRQAAEAETDRLGQQLADLRGARSVRWSQRARSWYAALRGSSGDRPGA
jgi:hypothetical protein